MLGRSAGVRLSTLVPDSPSTQEAPFVVGDGHDSDSSVLASATLVPRSSGAQGRRASCASSVSRSTQTVSFPPLSSGDPQAVSSCLATVQ